MMTVDEILASGTYTDRRGRYWENITHWGIESWQTGPYGKPDIRPDEMRLLIERDMHRVACDGLIDCGDHPVPIVEIDGPTISRTGCYYVRGPKSFTRVGHHHELDRAVDDAYRLAVAK